MSNDPLRKLCFEASLGRWAKNDAGRQELREYVRTREVDPNGLYRMQDGKERTPLSVAVMHNQVAFARVLLSLEPRAADPNLVLPDGETALTLAVKHEHHDCTEMVRVLLARGADPAQLDPLVDDARLNYTMRYWKKRAHERAPFDEQLLKAFALDGLREVEFSVVGEEAATKQIMDSIIHWRGQPAAREKPLVLWIVGAPGHGKTVFSRNLAKALVGEDHFQFVAMGGIKSDKDLFGFQWANQGDDGIITAFLAKHQQQYTVVMLDEIEKAGDVTDEGGHGRSKAIFKSLLAPWQEGKLQNKGKQGRGGSGGNLKASDSERNIDCSKCIFICTTNLTQEDIIQFWRDNAQHTGRRLKSGADVRWLHKELVKKTIEPKIFDFFRSIDGELQALVRRIDKIVPFLPLVHEEQVVVADMELRKYFNDYREPPVTPVEAKDGKESRLAGNLLIRHTEDVAKLCRCDYDMMQGASSMQKKVRDVTEPVTTSYISRKFDEAEEVEVPAPGRDTASGPKTVKLRKIWLYVPEDDDELVEIKLSQPPLRKKAVKATAATEPIEANPSGDVIPHGTPHAAAASGSHDDDVPEGF